MMEPISKIIGDVNENNIKDTLPVALRQAVSCDVDELMMKVHEEFAELQGMCALYEKEIDENGEANEITENLLAKECVDLIFAANTFITSFVLMASDRDKLFKEVYLKNKKRGYYDAPSTDNAKDILTGIIEAIEEVDKCAGCEGGNEECCDDCDECEDETTHSPSYYAGCNGRDVIDISHELGLDKDAYLFNCFKYIARAGKKPGNTAESDIMKAIDYLQRKLEVLGDEENAE